MQQQMAKVCEATPLVHLNNVPAVLLQQLSTEDAVLTLLCRKNESFRTENSEDRAIALSKSSSLPATFWFFLPPALVLSARDRA